MNLASIFFKRTGAYLIDICLVSFVVLLLTYIPVLNPHRLEYSEKYNELYNLSEQYIQSEISEEEYEQALQPISYQIHRYETNYVIIDAICMLLYFGVFQYYFHGQTIGKKLFRIQIVSNNDEPLSLTSLIIRSIVLNNTLISLIKLAVIWGMTQESYFTLYENVNFVGAILNYIIIFMILVRQDGRGLHDFVGNTRVKLTEIEVKERLEQMEIEQEVLEKELENYKIDKKKKSTKKSQKKS